MNVPPRENWGGVGDQEGATPFMGKGIGEHLSFICGIFFMNHAYNLFLGACFLRADNRWEKDSVGRYWRGQGYSSGEDNWGPTSVHRQYSTVIQFSAMYVNFLDALNKCLLQQVIILYRSSRSAGRKCFCDCLRRQIIGKMLRRQKTENFGKNLKIVCLQIICLRRCDNFR